MGKNKKGERYSPRFRFQVVLEVLKGDREAVEIARAYNIHPTSVSRWKQEFLDNGAEVFGKDKTVARYEKRGLRVLRILTDRGTEFCERADTHDYQLYLTLNDINHTKTKAKSPQTNGICERFHKTVCEVDPVLWTR